MKNRFKIKMTALLSILALNFASQVGAAMLIDQKDDAITSILSKRYSGRSYDPSRLVTKEQLRAIVEASRLAPSSYNEQPWYFLICDRTTNPVAYEKAFSTLVEFNQGWAKNAPVLIVSIAASKSTQNDGINRWAQYDTGAAAFSMMLKATAMGLMAHQMGGFDEVKMRKLFAIPDDLVPMAVIAIGYASADEIAPPQKQRKPISDNYFMGAWGNSFKD